MAAIAIILIDCFVLDLAAPQAISVNPSQQRSFCSSSNLLRRCRPTFSWPGTLDRLTSRQPIKRTKMTAVAIIFIDCFVLALGSG